MHLYKERQKAAYRGLVVTAFVFAALLCVFLLASRATRNISGTQQAEIVKNAVQRAAVACYAIEGRYPPSAEYLKEHYGVAWNEERYIVSIDAFAVNVMPSVTVLTLGVSQ